jgi:hypothetical protein
MGTVYVYLMGEGTDVWRPVNAEQVGASQYRLDPTAVVPDDEAWEFPPGTLVECERKRLSDGEQLVAVRRAE